MSDFELNRLLDSILDEELKKNIHNKIKKILDDESYIINKNITEESNKVKYNPEELKKLEEILKEINEKKKNINKYVDSAFSRKKTALKQKQTQTLNGNLEELYPQWEDSKKLSDEQIEKEKTLVIQKNGGKKNKKRKSNKKGKRKRKMNTKRKTI